MDWRISLWHKLNKTWQQMVGSVHILTMEENIYSIHGVNHAAWNCYQHNTVFHVRTAANITGSAFETVVLSFSSVCRYFLNNLVRVKLAAVGCRKSSTLIPLQFCQEAYL